MPPDFTVVVRISVWEGGHGTGVPVGEGSFNTLVGVPDMEPAEVMKAIQALGDSAADYALRMLQTENPALLRGTPYAGPAPDAGDA